MGQSKGLHKNVVKPEQTMMHLKYLKINDSKVKYYYVLLGATITFALC